MRKINCSSAITCQNNQVEIMINRCMAKLSLSPPGILLFETVRSCHYIKRAKVCLLSVILSMR